MWKKKLLISFDRERKKHENNGKKNERNFVIYWINKRAVNWNRKMQLMFLLLLQWNCSNSSAFHIFTWFVVNVKATTWKMNQLRSDIVYCALIEIEFQWRINLTRNFLSFSIFMVTNIELFTWNYQHARRLFVNNCSCWLSSSVCKCLCALNIHQTH